MSFKTCLCQFQKCKSHLMCLKTSMAFILCGFVHTVRMTTVLRMVRHIVHFCANQTVSLTNARARALRAAQIYSKRKRENNKGFIRERAFTSFSLDSNANEIRSLVSNDRSKERETTTRGIQRERRTMMTFVFFYARILCGKWTKKTTKKGRTRVNFGDCTPHRSSLAR